MRRLRQAGVVVVVVAVVGGVMPATAVAAPTPPPVPPPTLTGEDFVDFSPTITATCNANGTSTINFSASGVATGPYPGPFTESGSATIGPQTTTRGVFAAGPLLTFDATFRIDASASPTTPAIVTGTKQIALPTTDTGICTATPSQTAYLAQSQPTYDARIQMSTGGAYRDQGSAYASAGVFQGSIDNSPAEFFEYFTSSLTAPIPLAPTSKEQCKNGGYSNYVDDQGQQFKNQGQCIKYVHEHGG